MVRNVVWQECRKDLILENDFINQRTKVNNTSLVNRYSKKIKNNKMRFYYLFGFSALFSLGYIYDRTYAYNQSSFSLKYTIEAPPISLTVAFPLLSNNYNSPESTIHPQRLPKQDSISSEWNKNTLENKLLVNFSLIASLSLHSQDRLLSISTTLCPYACKETSKYQIYPNWPDRQIIKISQITIAMKRSVLISGYSAA